MIRVMAKRKRPTSPSSAARHGRGSLAAYDAKRNFKSSPEPTGDQKIRQEKKQKKVKKPIFCVQKHLASQLHYDFRLEHSGVLLSWAVPRGPSLNPKDKRLSMRVEDHPLDYADFEGVIPEGYGAGIVMLWDKGTWEPAEGFEDVDRALADGELKFRLNGIKLKGSWVLVRTRGPYGRNSTSRGTSGSEESRSWLLIKHRDEWAGDIDIIQVAPQSVKSFGDFEDILAGDTPDVWQSHRPAKGGVAGKMLAEIIERAAQLKAGKKPAAPAKRKTIKGRRRSQQKGAARV
jgi:bifunctional non-homologous end joining protein LigD